MTGPAAFDAGWNARDFFADDADARVIRDLARHRLRKPHAIDGERRASRHARQIGRAHDQRAQPAHLLFQEADGVVQFVAAEGIAADELGEAVGLVHRGRACTGRISWMTTGTSIAAACHAASQPARPPPMMLIMARADIELTCRSVPARTRHQRVRHTSRTLRPATQAPVLPTGRSCTPRCCRRADARGAW